MPSLFLHIVLLSSFELIVKRGTTRQLDMLTIGTLNFVVAAPLGFFLLLGQTGSSVKWESLFLGTIMGVCYFWSYSLVLYSIHHQGVAPTRAFMQLSILIPITFSVFWWNERPRGTQTLGMMIALGSLLLLDAGRDLTRKMRATLRWKLAGMLLFVGTARLSAKAFAEMGVPEDTTFFLLALFTSSGIAAGVRLVMQRPTLSPTDWSWGSVLGTLNVLHSLFLIKALHQLPGIIVFPAAACGSLVVTTLVATLLLGERPTSRQYVGMAASSLAVVLLNLTNTVAP